MQRKYYQLALGGFLFVSLALITSLAISTQSVAAAAPPPTNTPHATEVWTSSCYLVPHTGLELSFWTLPYILANEKIASDKDWLARSVYDENWLLTVTTDDNHIFVNRVNSKAVRSPLYNHQWTEKTTIAHIQAIYVFEVDGYQWLEVSISDGTGQEPGFMQLGPPNGTAYFALNPDCRMLFNRSVSPPGALGSFYVSGTGKIPTIPIATATTIPKDNVWYVTCGNLTGPLNVYEKPLSGTSKPIGQLYPGARIARPDPHEEIPDQRVDRTITRVAIYWPPGTSVSIAYVAIRDSKLQTKDGDYLRTEPDSFCASSVTPTN